MKSKVVAVIPALDEAGRIGRVIHEIPRDVVDAVIVVDDHSTDSTVTESLSAGASVVSNNGSRGAGAAIKTGYREGISKGVEVIVVLAGDMQHDPSEIPRLLEPIRDGRADYVTGDRLSDAPLAHGMPPLRYIGNVLLTFLTRLTTGVDVKDSQCGFTAITRNAIEKIEIEWLSDSWGITNTLLAECSRKRLKVRSVPVSTHYGARNSYIHLHAYVPWIAYILMKALFRTVKTRV